MRTPLSVWVIIAALVAFTVWGFLATQPAKPAELEYKIQLNLATGEMSPVIEIAIDPLPADPCQRCAVKALAGAFGELLPWQCTAYRLLSENGPARRGKAYVTHYTPPMFKRGQGTRWGWGCTEGCWAANKLPGYWYVLVRHPNSGFWEVGWIRDTGASWNDSRWKRVGQERYGVKVDLWLDRWHPSPKMANVSWPGAKYVAISAQNSW